MQLVHGHGESPATIPLAHHLTDPPRSHGTALVGPTQTTQELEQGPLFTWQTPAHPAGLTAGPLPRPLETRFLPR